MRPPSPKITHISWGKIEVEGLPTAKDYKLYPGGGREWNWLETGTRHQPGIQPADVVELIEHGSRIIILSRGMHLVLRTMPETIALLDSNGIEVRVLESKAAAEAYNELAKDQPVGGLFHSTC